MPHVAILVFPGVQSLDVTGPMDVFAEANRFLPSDQHYYVTVIGTQPGPITCSNGLSLLPHKHFDEVFGSFDLFLTAGGPGLPSMTHSTALLSWLKQCVMQASLFGSICNGIFFLAHAELLNGKRVTTHWNDAAQLGMQFHEVTVDEDCIFIHDGRLVTSAGVTAGIDLALYLLSTRNGSELSLNVAKRLVVPMQRHGGQSQFSPYLVPYVEASSPVAVVQQYILEHLDGELNIDKLAATAAMSSRHFSRIFARDTKITPADFIERARIDAARILLETSKDPMKTIAHRSGFKSPNQMRQAFVKRLGVTALEYRNKFSSIKSE